MIGYHYTSLENYEQIKWEGLTLYPLRKEFAQFGITKGIWLYTERQKALSHSACICWQCLRKKTQNVVLLQVSYKDSDRITPNGLNTFSVKHDLFDEWPTKVFFHKAVSATVVFKPVLPERIKLLLTAHIEDVNYLVKELRKTA